MTSRPTLPSPVGRLRMVSRTLSDHAHFVRASMGVMVSTAVTSALGWIFWVVATHHWQASQVGVSTSLIAAMTVISLVAAQPIATTLLARLPRSPHQMSLVLASCAFCATTSVVLSLVAVGALPGTLSVVRDAAVATSFTVGCIAVAVGIVLDAASVAVRRPLIMVVRNSTFGFGKLIGLVVVAAALPMESAPRVIVVVWSATCVVACVWSWMSLRRAVSTTDVESKDAERVSARVGWPHLRRGIIAQTFGTWGGSLPPQVLPVIVVGILGSTQAGFFAITWLLGGLCFMISPAVSQALLADASHDPDQASAKTRLASKVSLAILAVPMAVYVFASRPVLDIFGAKYGANGHWLLVILAISAIPDLVTNIAVARYRVVERLRMAALVNVSIAVVAILGAALYLRSDGIDAAGWSWTAGQVVGCLIVAGEIAVQRVRRASAPTPVPT